MHRFGFALAIDDFRRVLCNICAAHFVSNIRHAPVETERAKNDYTARRCNCWYAGWIPKIACLVARSLIVLVLHQLAYADVGKGHYMCGTVVQRHIIYCRPTGDVRGVGKAEVTTILMP